MSSNDKEKVVEKKKGMLSRWLDQLDKKMQEKAKSSCGCSVNKPKGGKCC